jgi:hypothetical protein
MSIVEPNDVALRFVESLVLVVHRGQMLTPIGGLRNEWKRSVCHRKDEWKRVKFDCRERLVDILESQGDILGSMNVATHDLALIEVLREGMDQMYVRPHSCHLQWTICDPRKLRPVCYVCQRSFKFDQKSGAHSKRCKGSASEHRDRDSLICR